MFTLLRAGRAPEPTAEDEQITDHAGRRTRYLTDGFNLYRFLGAVPAGMGQMIGLENCYSLDVVLWPIGELRSRRLRAVVPAGQR